MCQIPKFKVQNSERKFPYSFQKLLFVNVNLHKMSVWETFFFSLVPITFAHNILFLFIIKVSERSGPEGVFWNVHWSRSHNCHWLCVFVWSGKTCCVPPSPVSSNALRCSGAWEPLPAILRLFGLAVLWFSWARWLFVSLGDCAKLH